MTLADVPQDCAAAAKTLAAAAGITDPGIAEAAALDFALTGDPGFLDAAANIQQQLAATTPATIPGTTPAVAAGVMAEARKVTEAASGPTPVTFHVCMTGTETTDTVFNYQVIAPGGGFLGAAAFGGTLPSGTVTISAGQTEAPFTIDVPQGALGTDPSDNLEVQMTNSTGIPVFAPTAQTEIVNDQPEPGNAAVPVIAKVSGNGTLTFNSATNTYTLALGDLVAGTGMQAVQLAVVNADTFPGDSLAAPSAADRHRLHHHGQQFPRSDQARTELSGALCLREQHRDRREHHDHGVRAHGRERQRLFGDAGTDHARHYRQRHAAGEGAAQHALDHHLPQRARRHARDAECQHHQHGDRAGGEPRCDGEC